MTQGPWCSSVKLSRPAIPAVSKHGRKRRRWRRWVHYFSKVSLAQKGQQRHFLKVSAAGCVNLCMLSAGRRVTPPHPPLATTTPQPLAATVPVYRYRRLCQRCADMTLCPAAPLQVGERLAHDTEKYPSSTSLLATHGWCSVLSPRKHMFNRSGR